MDKALYTRPNKPDMLYTKSRPRNTEPPPVPDIPGPVVVDKATDCYVTPPDVAARMVEYLGASPDMLTLEPSAGTGNLLQELLDSGHSMFEIIGNEMNLSLAAALESRFCGAFPIMRQDFLEYATDNAGKQFPRILMNPPFRKVKAHMQAALSLLGTHDHDSAVLVALVPITYQHPEAERLEELPRDTFAGITVNTKLIRIER